MSNPFEYGSGWVRADFHLHTKADKEFKYGGEDTDFTSHFVDHLKTANIRLGLIANHNKFNVDEFKALRKKARKDGIGLLPGVELSVNDGANGVHTLVVFSDEWLEEGQDYINQFLNVAFTGKTPAQYEQENGRSSHDLLNTLKSLEGYDKGFFIIFAHVEAPSGLWNEVKGGRMQELAGNHLIQKYCLAFQKVRTHDKPDVTCRVKVQEWWRDSYPAEVEGSDPKNLDEIGRGEAGFLKVGDFTFDAVKYALMDFNSRVAKELPIVSHSHIRAIRFEGGILNRVRLPFSPHLNCLIGIRGSGKSSILESIRYAMDIPHGQKAEDKDYKENLLPYVLKSGGKLVLEVMDRHGTYYEIRRILGHNPDVYCGETLCPGVAIRETIVKKPLYFGQKDLSSAGKGFGQDLVEKLVGEILKPVRTRIEQKEGQVKTAVDQFLALQSDEDQKQADEQESKDVKFRLEQFDKYGVKDKLEKQVEFGKDITFCEKTESLATQWHTSLADAITQTEEDLCVIGTHSSKYNTDLFLRYQKQLDDLKDTVSSARTAYGSIEPIIRQMTVLKQELEIAKTGLKDEFAQTERDLVKSLESQGVTSIQPDAYIKLVQRKAELETTIADLTKTTSKVQEKNDNVLKAMAQLNDGWHEEFRLIEKALDAINSAQSPLKVQTIFKGDKLSFSEKMEEIFRGNGIRKETYKELSDKYTDFGEIYKELDVAVSLAKGKTAVLKEKFLANLYQLLTYQVPNSYEITYHGKPLRSHSLGQRASAMMLFILSQKENDLLLIDQPEDDLDSQTIYEEVVKLLREIKPNLQFIFATHNANFPVLGDAELVTSCHANEDNVTVQTGSIDTKTCQQKIIDIMEGGPEAFARRRTIYQIWKAGD